MALLLLLLLVIVVAWLGCGVVLGGGREGRFAPSCVLGFLLVQQLKVG